MFAIFYFAFRTEFAWSFFSVKDSIPFMTAKPIRCGAGQIFPACWRALPFAVAVVFSIGFFPQIARCQGTTELVMATGDLIPGMNGPVDKFHRYICDITDEGTILVYVQTKDAGEYLTIYQDGESSIVLSSGTPELDQSYGFFNVFGSSDIGFPLVGRANSLDSLFSYSQVSGQFQNLASGGDVLPDGNGTYLSVDSVSVGKTGKFASLHRYSNTTNGTSDNSGIWVWDGASFLQIVREGDSTPDGNNIFDLFLNQGGDLRVNASGQVSFPAILNVANQEKAIFFWNGTSIEKVAKDGELDPSGNPFSVYYQADLNDHEDVAFAGGHIYLKRDGVVTSEQAFPFSFSAATYTAPDSGVLEINNSGEILFDARNFASPEKRAIAILKGGVLLRVVEDDQTMPDGRVFDVELNETISMLNENGVVGFKGESWDNGFKSCIYLTDGAEYVRVAQEGDLLGKGIVVEKLEVDWTSRQGGKFMNDYGQVVYLNQVESTGGDGYGSGSVHLFTPALCWRSQSGNWDDKDNWTLGLPPAMVHDVAIVAEDVVVTGPPGNTTVKSLEIGGNSGHAELRLGLAKGLRAGVLTATDGVLVETLGVLSGTGTVTGNVTISGQLSPGNELGEITVDGQLELSDGSSTSLDINGVTIGEFDRFHVTGSVLLGGGLDVSILDHSMLNDGQQFLLGLFSGKSAGHFEGYPEGSILFSNQSVQVKVSYQLGDGNDFGLVVSGVDAIGPLGRKLLDGVVVAGALPDLAESDDSFLELDPSPTTNPFKQVVDVVVLAESTESSPSSFGVCLESCMSGGPGGDVIQTIELWNEVGQQWELVDTRPATNADAIVYWTAKGDLSRFVHPVTNEILARLRWESPSFDGKEFKWSLKLDRFNWMIN